MHCWKCTKEISDLPIKIGFRAICRHCDTDLHVCKNCRYYAPGKPNDCLVPGTEYIRDRAASNLCEEFKPLTALATVNQETAKEKARKMFGLDEPEIKKDFNSLFKDD